MLRKLLLLFVSGNLLMTHVLGQKQAPPRPKLVVGIVVDQMRWDYLYRYQERYQSGGFNRLMREGTSCEQTYINYLPSYTAPGHAGIYTGSVPSIHGIAGNDWIDNHSGRNWYCTEDTTVQSVGGSAVAGRMSPANLLTTTITDELRLATNLKSRVFGISLKDRGSILPAGHLANGAYWFDDNTGNLISSTYYGATLPAWLEQFNSTKLADTLLRRDWQPLYALNTYTQSISDDNPFEGLFKGETKPVFPHKVSTTAGYGNLRKIPAGNTYSLAAAKACIRGEQLGKRIATDFFCLSLSTSDYIGHQFAPNSIEVEDQYLRVDQELAVFLDFLDSEVGKGNYLLFLTADHGGAHNASFLKSMQVPAGYFAEAKTRQQLDSVIRIQLKQDSLIRAVDNYQVFLNEEAILRKKVNRQELKQIIRLFLLDQPGVAYVADLEDINNSAIPEPIRTMIINGYHRRRSGVLQIITDPGWYSGYGVTGTTHGTWHPYDTHIPLLWYGWQVKKGKSVHRKVQMQDIAPTLSALLHIQVPNGNIGTPIPELLDNGK